MVVDEANFTLWTFTPPDHPAHPSSVKRAAVEEDGAIYIRMSAKCEASKTECDKLTAEFVALNEQVRRDLEAGNLSAF